ncbi:MFS transporter [Trichothermofontia sp.]
MQLFESDSTFTSPSRPLWVDFESGLPQAEPERPIPERLAAHEAPDNAPTPPSASGGSGSPNPSPPETGFLPVLKNFNFLALWSGQVFSQLADKVYLVLMIALITTQFQPGSESISHWVSAIMIAFTIPAVLFGSVAGVYIDRWPKKTVLVATNLWRGLLVIGLPLLLWLTQGQSIWSGLPLGFAVLLGVTFLVSTLTQFFAPAEQAIIPLIVPRRHLLSANSLYATTMMAAVIIGFAVGEPMLTIADTLALKLGRGIGIGRELVVGGGYLLASLALLLLRTGEQKEHEVHEVHVWDDIREGLRYLVKQPRVASALLQLVILFSIFAALAVLSVRLADVMPALNPSQFGFLLAAGGGGMAVGAAMIGHWGQWVKRARLGLWGSIGMAISLASLAIVYQQLVPTLILLTGLGACAAAVAVPMQTTIQAETPEAMRGKVFGLQNNAINIALTLPLVLASVAESIVGLPLVFLGLAGLTIAGGLICWYISHTKVNLI